MIMVLCLAQPFLTGKWELTRAAKTAPTIFEGTSHPSLSLLNNMHTSRLLPRQLGMGHPIFFSITRTYTYHCRLSRVNAQGIPTANQKCLNSHVKLIGGGKLRGWKLSNTGGNPLSTTLFGRLVGSTTLVPLCCRSRTRDQNTSILVICLLACNKI